MTPPAAHEPLLRQAGWPAPRVPAPVTPRPDMTRLPGLGADGQPLF